jgi:hypothetical protein
MPKAGRERVAVLVSLLRVADGLDRSRRGIVRSLTLRPGAELSVNVDEGTDAELEMWSTQRKAQLFDDVFGCSVTVELAGVEYLTTV